jgi:alpha-amylase/alpha-mannosidase (GH57 family)
MTIRPRGYICIHGHFYQPPRENPWLEVVERQESAHPFHDWNERITEECYAPNTAARILDAKGRLRDIVNNYEHMSFDFGPTLLSWLEVNAEESYHGILDADAVSVKCRSGHGNALAQAYNHMIMPLASQRDKITQIIWGIEDFQKRFRRDPEGMWLPETAVDRQTLEIMARHGIKFTILAPRQASRFRASPRDQWMTLIPGTIDPTRPYVCRLSSGRSIVLFFYDGPISQSIAFERLLNNGEEFKDRLLAAFSQTATWPQLVHIATDGESYGHHHRFGEMALAYALNKLSADTSVRLTNYGEFLEKHPPMAEAEFIENSSWSCAHGVGRWCEDCGCSLSQRPDWNQKWRGHLRRSLDLVRRRVDRLFTEQSGGLLKDPWQARNSYVRVLLKNHSNVVEFLKEHATRDLTEDERVLVMNLLEMQRNRMLMYTSCGWFFDDITGIESLQVLEYAARVLQLAYPIDPDLPEDFLKELGRAVSNVKPHIRGDEIFKEKVLPQTATLDHVAAHVAISYIFENLQFPGSMYCYDIKPLDLTEEEIGERICLIGQMEVVSRLTTERRRLIVAVIYFGRVDLRCSVEDFSSDAAYRSLKDDLLSAFITQSSTELIRKLDRYFPREYFSLKDLFTEQRSHIIEMLTKKMYEEEAATLKSFYKKNEHLARLIITHNAAVPDTFLAAARFVLQREFLEQMEKITAGSFPSELEAVLSEMKLWKLAPDIGVAEKLIQNRIINLIRELSARSRDESLTSEIIKFLDLGRDLDITLQLGEAQIMVFRVVRSLEADSQEEVPPQILELAERLAVSLNRTHNLLTE